MLIVVAVVGVGAAIWQLYDDALDDARRDSGNLALTLSEQTRRALQPIDIVLKNVVEDIDKLEVSTPGDFRRAMGSTAIYSRLNRHLAQIPQAEALTIVGADGFILNTTRVWPAVPLDLRDRDFYRHFTGVADRGVFISEPVRNRTTDTWTVYLARRLGDAASGYLGVIIAAVPLETFNLFYRDIALSRGERLILHRRDGLELLRHPHPNGNVAQRVPAEAGWHAALAEGRRHYDTAGPFSGRDGLVAVAPIDPLPLVTTVIVSYDRIFAKWRRQAAMLGGGAIVLLACALALMLAVRRQMWNLQVSHRAIEDRNAQLLAISDALRVSKEDFEATLKSIDQGFFLIDASGRVCVYNDRALELLCLPDDLLRAKPYLADILRYQWDVNKVRTGEQSFEQFAAARLNVHDVYVGELARPDGRVLEVRSTPTASGGAVRIYTDITNRQLAEQRIRYFAQHDELTRLINRSHFGEKLDSAIEDARGSRRGFTVMYLDLDGFKQVNDVHGHAAGDAVLIEVAHRMEAVVRATDTVARIGGDEFAVLLPSLTDAAVIRRLADQLIACINEIRSIHGADVAIGASIGAAMFPEHGHSAPALLQRADAALYEAKRGGKNTVRVFAPRPAAVAPSRG